MRCNRLPASFPAPHLAAVASLVVLLGLHVVHAQVPAGPDPVPSKLYVPPDIAEGRFAASPAFVGSGVEQFNYHVSAINPDPPTTNISVGPHKTGVVYTFPDPISASTLNWERASGGFATRVKIVADRAESLRIHLSFTDQLQPIEIRIQGNQDATVLGPVTGPTGQDREVWLPVTLGGEAVLEVFVPNQPAIPSIGLQVDQINYIFGGTPQPGQFASIGLAQQPEYDAACYSNNPDYAAIQAGVAATAKITFVSNGSSYECSGTLLNDRGSTTTPWFATANHCIPTQSVASTMVFYWHYEATSCGAFATDSRYKQTYGGAKLLWSDVTYDAAFLKLNNPPALSTVFAGWNTGSLLVGDHVYGIHHPRGDHTMVSDGTVTALDVPITSINTGATLTLNKVKYTYGGVEGGSSGSGVFTIQNGGLRWKGALFGDSPSNYQQADYGPFDNFYNNVLQYLENTISPVATDTQAPTVPTGVTATPVSSSQITLVWTASTDNVGVTAYKVYRGGTLVATLGNVTSYNDTGLATSALYTYTVQACDAAGNCSAKSSSTSASTSAPASLVTSYAFVGSSTFQVIGSSVNITIDRITNKSLTNTSGSLRVELWALSAPYSYPNAVLGYRVASIRTASVSGATDQLAPNGSFTGVSLTLPYTAPPAGYTYYVLFLDELQSQCTAADHYCFVAYLNYTPTAQDTQPPTVPTGLTATATSSSQISLSWTASADAVGVAAYKVYRGGTLIVTLGNVTSYNDSGLTPSIAYTYTVQACDVAANCSVQSSPISATTQQAGATNVNVLSNCLFNWAESSYASLFSPRGVQSLGFGPYYYRFYSQTNAYLGVSSSNNHLFYVGSLSSNALLDLGTVSGWYATAGCR
jgi:chitodextrinase